MKRYTSHDTSASGAHVWDQEQEKAALFATLRDADYARDMLNSGFSSDMYLWACA